MQKKKLRILFSTNAPWSTSGYAQQIRELAPKIRDAGYDVGIVCFYGLDGGKIILDGITMYPKIGDMWGEDAVINHQNDFKADVVITLQDIWVLKPEALKHFKNWIAIVPIDHEPTPPAIRERLKMAYRVITYSPFGKRQLQEEGINSTYIPHTVDIKLFKKVNKSEMRKQLNIPEDIFLFGMVAANKDNPSRKSFQEAMDAFAIFHKKHPKSGMYFHTMVKSSPGFQGFPIEDYAKVLGIQDSIYTIPLYELLYKVSKEDMHKIYNAFDCLLSPSENEGFGVPIIEAQACEIPVITTRFTAMRDMIVEDKTGFFCEVNYKRFTPLGSYVAMPDINSIYKAMKKVYSANREKMGQEGRKFVSENFDLNKVFKEKWLPFLLKIEKEVCKVDDSKQVI